MIMKPGRTPILASVPRALASRFLLVALIAIAPVTLVTLAHASPADPSWVQGIYDDADHDDVAMFLTSETGEVRVAITPHPPIHVAAGRVMPPTERAGPVVAVRATRSRAPPAS
jgi:hypothetical protein